MGLISDGYCSIVVDIGGHAKKFKFYFFFLAVDDFNKRFKIALTFLESQFVTIVERNIEKLNTIKSVKKY